MFSQLLNYRFDYVKSHIQLQDFPLFIHSFSQSFIHTPLLNVHLYLSTIFGTKDKKKLNQLFFLSYNLVVEGISNKQIRQYQ